MATNINQSTDVLHPLAFSFVEKCKNLGASLKPEEINAIDFLARQLIQNNLWDKFKAIYPFVGRSSITHSLNFKNINRHNIVWYNSANLIHDKYGVTNKSNGYGNTFVAPSWFNDNNIHISVYCSDFWQNMNSFSPILGSSPKNDGNFMHTIFLRSNEPTLNANEQFVRPPIFTYACGPSRSANIRFAGSDASQFSHIETHGFIVGVNGIKCYVNGEIYGRQGLLTDVSTSPINKSTPRTVFNTTVQIPNISQFPFLLFTNEPLGSESIRGRANANIRFASIGYEMNDDENKKLYNIIQEFQKILSRHVTPIKLKTFEETIKEEIFSTTLNIRKITHKKIKHRREYLNTEKPAKEGIKINSLYPNLKIKKITIFGPIRIFCSDSVDLSVSIQSFVEI